MSCPIEDYALIGDRRTAALVGRDGSIDWLCWPRFDSEACFASLLGKPDHGHWRVGPEGEWQAKRRYQPDTLILETEFETASGSVRLIDFMPVGAPCSSIVRIVTGLRGTVPMALDALVRFEYGQIRPLLVTHGDGLKIVGGAVQIVLNSPIALDASAERIHARFTVQAGDSLAFTMACDASYRDTPSCPDPSESLRETASFWQSWIGTFDRPTVWPEAVKRSLLTIKALIHAPTGGIVAAPTMGLPEKLGGSLNWDYRYCWLRDATFTLTALLNAGYHEEATRWRDWILRTAAGSPEKLQVFYQVDGRRSLDEVTLPWLPGYAGSTPVRKGNAAAGQRQLDVFGEVIDALYLAGKAGLDAGTGEFALVSGLADFIEQIWQQPDKGLWEARGQSQNFTYSRVMAWLGIERFVTMAGTSGLAEPGRIAHLRALAGRIHAQICQDAYDAALGHFVEYYGAHHVDGSLLLLPLVGFLPIDDPRIQGTIAAVQRELMEDGLVLRRKTATTGEKEGAFIACTCWLADCLTMAGQTDEARALIERVLAVRNDVGLLAEEYDVQSGRLVGNFPQALSHLALVNSALQLSGPVLQRAAG